MTRVSPGSNTVEIFSRPRLSHVSWLLHCRFKVQVGNATGAVFGPGRPHGGRVVEPAGIYEIADASGLHYGPAFRLVDKVVVHDARFIGVELDAPDGESPFLLDPMRADCCGHGFFTLLPGLHAAERGVTYIPVRLEEVAYYRPHVAPRRALVEVVSKSERSIVCNSFFYGEDDEIVAVIHGIRNQAISTRRASVLEAVTFIELPQLIDGTIVEQTGCEAAARDIVSAAKSLGAMTSDSAASSESEMLIEGWATAAAYEIAAALADDGTIDVDALIAAGRLPERLQTWLVNLLGKLVAADLATQDKLSWTLVPDNSLPSSGSVVRTLAAEQQSHAAEILLAAAVSGFAKQIATGAPVAASETAIPRSALDFYNTTSISLRDAGDTLHQVLLATKRLWPKNRVMRVLQIGFAPVTNALVASQHKIALTIFEADRRRYESAELAVSRHRKVRLIDAEHADQLAQYDLIVAVAGLHRLPAELGLTQLKGKLAPGGLIVAVEPRPSLFKDMVFGLDPGWFLPGRVDRPVSSLRPLASWPARLENAGFRNAEAVSVRCGLEFGYLIVAEAAQAQGAADPVMAPQLALGPEKNVLVVAPAAGNELAEKLKASMTAGGSSVSMIVDVSDYPAIAQDIIVMVPEIADNPSDPVAGLTRRCLDIKACAERIDSAPATLWLLFSGALASGRSPVNPVETGAWAFSRTLANEFAKLDVRRIDIAPRLSAESAARYIHHIVASQTKETELHVDEQSIHAVRVAGLKQALDGKAFSRRTGARLERRSAAGQRLAWEPIERRRPGPGEVEIEVEAAGLNFRDLMWSLSLLPDDMLENGFSGPTLGLECAGRIGRVGPSVKNRKVGDRVMLFSPSSFATHLTVSGEQAVKLPENLSCTSAPPSRSPSSPLIIRW